MPTIAERELGVFISLLAGKIRDMQRELSLLQSLDVQQLSDEQIEEHCQLQETIEQYELMLDGVREEYEAGLGDGSNLPSYQELIRPPGA